MYRNASKDRNNSEQKEILLLLKNVRETQNNEKIVSLEQLHSIYVYAMLSKVQKESCSDEKSTLSKIQRGEMREYDGEKSICAWRCLRSDDRNLLGCIRRVWTIPV